MAGAGDPRWTEQLAQGRVIDPLQLDRVRNRILTDLLFGVVSIQIYQRLRYISFALWCLTNLEEPTKDELVALEKLFLLANIAHDHDTAKDRGGNGLSGAGNVPWDQEAFHDVGNTTFSLVDETFRIQESGSSGFAQYYRSIMERLLLIDGLEPTPLGQEIAAAFDDAVGVEFAEVQEAAEAGEVSREVVLRFREVCCCRVAGREAELLRAVYFGLVTPSMWYEELGFTEPGGVADLQLETESSEIAAMELLDSGETAKGDEYLERFFGGRFGAKMRESLVLFLWIGAQEKQEETRSLAQVEELGEIRECWRLFRYYDYLNFGCEALLSAVLWALKAVDGGVEPDALVRRIAAHEEYRVTIGAVLEGIRRSPEGEALDGLTEAFQYIYYGEPIDGAVSVGVADGAEPFEGDWAGLVEAVEEVMTPAAFAVDDPISEWALLRLIDEEVHSTAEDALTVSARIFAYVTVLLAVLQLRYQHAFNDDTYQEYWAWLAAFEKQPPGPVSVIQSLEGWDGLEEGLQSFVRRWVIDQYNTALYEKMDASRMPRLFRQEFTGEIAFQDTWRPRLSETKFDRVVDVLFDLGLVAEPDTERFPITAAGEDWLAEFVEVPE